MSQRTDYTLRSRYLHSHFPNWISTHRRFQVREVLPKKLHHADQEEDINVLLAVNNDKKRSLGIQLQLAYPGVLNLY